MEETIREITQQMQQPHLSAGLDSLSSIELHVFLQQLQKYDSQLLSLQQELVNRDKPVPRECSPCSTFERSGNEEDRLRGERLLREGKVGCLILAGGQGTRLGFH